MRIHHLITAVALFGASARAADVGVSVSVGDSGFYGRIDIGTVPNPPAVVYRSPVVVEPAPTMVSVERPPIYLRVPPGHAKHWRKHCHEYNACGERVFFVQERWYKEVYVPSHQARRDEDQERRERDEEHHARAEEHHGHGEGHGHDKN
jgi:hypothetical protein